MGRFLIFSRRLVRVSLLIHSIDGIVTRTYSSGKGLE
jgi:hypothetical protein